MQLCFPVDGDSTGDVTRSVAGSAAPWQFVDQSRVQLARHLAPFTAELVDDGYDTDGAMRVVLGLDNQIADELANARARRTGSQLSRRPATRPDAAQRKRGRHPSSGAHSRRVQPRPGAARSPGRRRHPVVSARPLAGGDRHLRRPPAPPGGPHRTGTRAGRRHPGHRCVDRPRRPDCLVGGPLPARRARRRRVGGDRRAVVSTRLAVRPVHRPASGRGVERVRAQPASPRAGRPRAPAAAA